MDNSLISLEQFYKFVFPLFKDLFNSQSNMCSLNNCFTGIEAISSESHNVLIKGLTRANKYGRGYLGEFDIINRPKSFRYTLEKSTKHFLFSSIDCAKYNNGPKTIYVISNDTIMENVVKGLLHIYFPTFKKFGYMRFTNGNYVIFNNSPKMHKFFTNKVKALYSGSEKLNIAHNDYYYTKISENTVVLKFHGKLISPKHINFANISERQTHLLQKFKSAKMLLHLYLNKIITLHGGIAENTNDSIFASLKLRNIYKLTAMCFPHQQCCDKLIGTYFSLRKNIEILGNSAFDSTYMGSEYMCVYNAINNKASYKNTSIDLISMDFECSIDTAADKQILEVFKGKRLSMLDHRVLNNALQNNPNILKENSFSIKDYKSMSLQELLNTLNNVNGCNDDNQFRTSLVNLYCDDKYVYLKDNTSFLLYRRKIPLDADLENITVLDFLKMPVECAVCH